MTVVDLDWRENKEYILKTLPRLESRIDDLEKLVRSGFKEMHAEITGVRSAMLPDIERFVAEIWTEARKSNSDEISKKKLEQLVNGRAQPKQQSWQPWQYVLLGATIAVAGDKLMELALKVL